METTAGSVTIAITATTAAFEAALARAQQQATAFDAQISAKLSGAGMSAGLAKIAGLIEQNNALLAKMAGVASPAAAGLDKVAAATKTATATLESLNLAQMKTKATFSIMGASMQQYETALVEINDANRIGVELEKQKATLSQGAIGALNIQAGAAGKVATETEHAASAARLGSTQMMSLAHAGRSAAEGLMLGVPTMQILTQQANHLSYALSGEGGLIAATADARAAFAGWLTSLPGIATTASVAAVAGLAAYVISTRTSIQSVDQVLSEHKALIDEIAAAYPEAAKAAKQYEEAAAKIPQSVASADIQDKIKENQKTLTDTLGFLTRQLQSVSEEFGLVGEKGAEAFGSLAVIGKSGAADAADRIAAALGRMRIDPSISENARQFAKDFQDAANQAAELQDKLNEKSAIKDIVDNNAKAVATLFSVSQGFKDVQASAGGADATITNMFGTLNAGSTGQFGVERSIQSALTGFQQVDQAVQEARRNQLSSFIDLDTQLRSTTQEAAQLRQALATAAGSDNAKLFFNDISGIANANAELQRSVDTVNRLFDAMNTGNASTRAVFEGLDMIRQTLIQDGFGVDAVNKFLDSLVRTRMQLDADTAGAKQLGAAVQALKDKTITIRVQTVQVGTGNRSVYDVPGGPVGVNRYGGNGAGPSLAAYSVPSSGYGSQGGYGNGGSSSVGVTRFSSTDRQISQTPIFNTSTNSWGYVQPTTYQDPNVLAQVNAMYPARAAGGPMSANMPYWVGERGPELVVPSASATVIPNAQSMAFANPQSAFTGQVATSDATRAWTLQMNIEGNTRKTAQLLDEIKTSAGASGIGGSSYSGSSSSSSTATDSQNAAYMAALATARSNYAAIGGYQPIGYGLDGLAATPEQIAHRAVYGFATGGIDSSDTQKVEFFKNPNEKVIIARPDQFTDVRSGQGSTEKTSGGGDQRPVHVAMSVTIQGGAQVSNDSIAEMRRQTALAVRDAMRSINGR